MEVIVFCSSFLKLGLYGRHNIRLEGFPGEADPVLLGVFLELWDRHREWPAWSQPVGAHDAYGEGDKVSHGGGKWVSTVASNVREAAAAGSHPVCEVCSRMHR